MLQCPCKQFKTNEFRNRMFLKPSSYYKYRGDILQHSVINNNETQSRIQEQWHRADKCWAVKGTLRSSFNL